MTSTSAFNDVMTQSVQAITIKYFKSYVPWEVFKHSAYSPHLLSYEFHVFGLFQKALKRLFVSFE